MNVIAFLLLMVACCGYSAVYGGGPERVAAAIIAAAVMATMLAGRLFFSGFATTEIAILAIDAAMFLGLLLLSVSADRYWPMAMTACVGVGLLAHAAVWSAPAILPNIYAAMHAFPSYPVLLILAVATFRHRRRVRRNGTDPSWSNSLG